MVTLFYTKIHSEFFIFLGVALHYTIYQKKKVKMILLSGNRDTTLDKICDEFIYIANVTEYLNMGGVIFSIGCRYVLDVLFGILISYNYKNVESFTKNFETINGKGPSDPNRLW